MDLGSMHIFADDVTNNCIYCWKIRYLRNKKQTFIAFNLHGPIMLNVITSSKCLF